jgi:hypothetical protein
MPVDSWSALLDEATDYITGQSPEKSLPEPYGLVYNGKTLAD